MIDTRSLATQLTHLDDEQLGRLIASAPSAALRAEDHFELAETLLSDDFLLNRLGPAHRTVIEALSLSPSAREDVHRDALADFRERYPEHALVLLHDDADGYPARQKVSALLAGQAGASIRALLDAEQPHPAQGNASESAAAFERAFHGVSALSELLRDAERGAVTLTARSALTLADAQRIAELTTFDTQLVHVLTSFALRRQLCCSISGQLRITTAGARWLERSSAQRWLDLVRLWWDAQPRALVTTLSNTPAARWDDDLTARIRWNFPAHPIDPQRFGERAVTAHALGLIENGTPTRAGWSLFTGDAYGLEESASAGMPADVDSAYIQHDMTVITTGPLVPSADRLFHIIADTELRSYASRYRLSERSLRRGLRNGLTVNEIRDRLRRISPAPLPQPLEYVLDDLEGRPETIVTTLPEPTDCAASAALPDAVQSAVRRLREGMSSDSESAWRERVLRTAIRDKQSVVVTVAMPDGSQTKLTLQPGSIAAGRLRARDVRADVERTLPIKLISAVEVEADSPAV